MDQECYDNPYDYSPQLSQQVSYDPMRQYSIDQSQGVNCLTQPEIYDKLRTIVEELMEEVYLDFDNTLELFAYYHWNLDQIKSRHFDEKDRLQGSIIYNHSFTKSSGVCGSCFTNTELVQMCCGHKFCRECIRNTIKATVEFSPNVRCLQDKCTYRLPLSFIEQESDQSTIHQYRKVLCKRFIDQSNNLANCTGVDCEYIIETHEQKEVKCKCGHQFCFRCKDELHRPAPCDLAQKWLVETKKDEANLKWISINTKLCPFCKRAVERSEGCNYLMCKPPGGCGKAFCYVCSNPWEPDHKDHFKCTKFVKDQQKENDINTQKEILRRYNHYYERFIESDASRKKSQQRLTKIPNYQKMVFEIYNYTDLQSQFLYDSVREYIDSRNVMKWSYCLAYYMSANDSQSSKLFDNYQEQFEVAAENLAMRLVKLFDEIERLDNQFLRKNAMEKDLGYQHQITQEFEKCKTEIQNSVTICNKYKTNLIDAVNNGDIYVKP